MQAEVVVVLMAPMALEVAMEGPASMEELGRGGIGGSMQGLPNKS